MVAYTLEQKVKILTGVGTISQIGDVLEDAGYTNAILVFDSGVQSTGVIEKIIGSLALKNISFIEFDKVLPDPPSDIVQEGYEVCQSNHCDCVIAIGGGSAIDTAKGINILRVNGGDILDYANPEKEMKKCLGLISIPTTSGTGSELSNGLIISDTNNNKKVAILAVNAMSEYAVIDPELAIGMPKGLTIMTGLDVFSHAAEAYTSILSNIGTDLICEKIMETIVEYLPTAVQDGTNLNARTKVHVAASLGGWMLANASAHVGHSIAHVIGGTFHIAHGACCAYGLPAVLRLLATHTPEKVKKIGTLLGADLSLVNSNEEIAAITAHAYIRFRDEIIGLKPLSDYNLADIDLEALTNAVVTEPLAGLCPVQIDKSIAQNLLNEIFD